MGRARIVISSIAALAALSVNACNSAPAPTATPITYQSRLESIVKAESISFEAAKANEALRQAYLNQLFLEREKLGGEPWLSFDSFIYDPKLELLDAALKKRGVKDNTLVPGYDSTTPGFKPLMATPYLGVRGVPLETYVSATAFDIVQSEDEILSILDNEAFTAKLFHKGKIHMDIKQPPIINPGMFNVIAELLSFEMQFYNIETGRRSVTPGFVNAFRVPARLLYQKVEQAAAGKGPDAEFARNTIEALRDRPTLKYFK